MRNPLEKDILDKEEKEEEPDFLHIPKMVYYCLAAAKFTTLSLEALEN